MSRSRHPYCSIDDRAPTVWQAVRDGPDHHRKVPGRAVLWRGGGGAAGAACQGITDPAQVLFAGELREDSHDRLALLVIGLVPGVSKSVLLALALASIGYLVLEAIEAAGLILGRLWVEWLIVVETGVFLPFEVYELAGHFTWLKVLILAANLLILSYLGIRRVQQARHDDRRLGSRYGNS